MLKKLNPKARKIVAVAFCLVILGCTFAVSVFATGDSTTTVTEPSFAEAAGEVYDAVHQTINFTNILAIIGVALGGSVTIYLLWWAIRKVTRMIRGALDGKLKV